MKQEGQVMFFSCNVYNEYILEKNFYFGDIS